MVRQRFSMWFVRFTLAFLAGWVICLDSGRAEDAVLSDVETLPEAEKQRAAIDAAGAEFNRTAEELLSVLNAAIARIPLDPRYTNFVDERRALDEMKAVVSRLIKDSDAVRAKFEPYLESGADYTVQLRLAGPYFVSAADEFRQFAEKEPYADYKADYETLAGVFELLAKRCEEMPVQLAPQLEEARELLKYLGNGRQFLTRCQSALNAIPETLDEKIMNEMLATLRSYARSYEGFRQSLRKLRGQMDPTSPPQTPAGDVVQGEGSLVFSQPIGPTPTLAVPSPARLSTPGQRVVATLASSTRNVIAFDRQSAASGGGAVYRRAVIEEPGVEVGDLIRIRLSSGGTKLVRIRDEVPALRTDAQRTWIVADVHPQSGGAVKWANEN
jgi:hypothetical protein